MKFGLTFKLFALTSVFLTLFILGSLFFQSFFFEQFYINKKISSIETNIAEFKTKYIKNTSAGVASRELIQNFQDNNNAKVVILTSSGVFQYVTDYIPGKNDIGSISLLNHVLSQWLSSPSKIASLKTSGQPVVYTEDTDIGIKNIVVITPATVASGKVDIIVSVSSLQPISEASGIIDEFYIYFFLGAVLIILVLSVIYSNMITKPLVALNNRASKIADMDFTTEYHIETNDEIGNLGKTLNFLSDNLNNALISLSESNEKLKRDIEKERSLEKMRKEFVAGVSHELKTPISLIEGYAEGLKDNIVDGENRDFYLDVIIDEAKQMADLVSDMLDLSYLESGTYKLNLTKFTMSELLLPLQRKFATVLKDRCIDFQIALQDDPLLVGDIKRIDQVLINFITNAIKHTPDGGNIAARMYSDINTIRLEIENQGSPISESDVFNIWDRFYKADKSRNRDAGGTGLGLAIVKNILLLHGSNFGVKNNDNGVCFYFTLNKAT